MTKYQYDPYRKVGEESSKTYDQKIHNGFFDQYMSGKGLELGYKGYLQGIVPILETAIGVDLDYPGYDGKTLPFADESQDFVYNSHTLEHIDDYKQAIKEWFRVTKTGGHIIIVVPHQFLYEKKSEKPSRWNGDHKRYYTPALLLLEIEQSLIPNTYRVRLCQDNDQHFDYTIPPEKHSGGCYEIECVIQKIKKPNWDIK